jgi:sulfur-oxidizing protein SoxZ
MADPMKIRATMQGDVAEVKVLVNHPMETGNRKDSKTGELIPAHFIQSLAVKVGDKQVMDAQIGGSVSRNPFFGFRVKGAKAGEKIVVTWKDNKGESRTDETTIA